LLSIFASLSQEERDAILDPKGVAKVPPKENLSETSKPVDVTADASKGLPEGPKKQQKKKGEDEENDLVRSRSAISYRSTDSRSNPELRV
jgi:chromatin assembly factor 1 subunit A